jgi:DNA-binding LacI/PurR family transcriptional regulator
VDTPSIDLPKYKRVYDTLWREIRSGKLEPGQRLPSEAELGRMFGASRITVGRAVRDLQVQGLVERRVGSGTFVRQPDPPRLPEAALSFGLLIPDLGETEIFEPVCQGMMASPLAQRHALVWGSPHGAGASKADRAWQLCRHYIDRGVSGVFFAPLESGAAAGTSDAADVNARIVDALAGAGIPIVLLDRPVHPYPDRGAHDLVGIDNRRAGFAMTAHLAALGARRISFVAMPNAAATVDAREAGYREALFSRGLASAPSRAHRLDPSDPAAVRALVDQDAPEGIVCANDRTAARLMQVLLKLGHTIPRDIRLVGIDDVEFASLLPVPLTTWRQPTRQIGEAALAAMLDRIARRDAPARDILLDCRLIVRDSCGGTP